MKIPVTSEGDLPAPFIVGVGRSGTTLLRLMLDAHPDLAIPAETHFVPALIAAAEAAQEPQAALQVLASAQTWPNLGLDLASVSQAFAALDPFSPAGVVRTVFRLYAEGQGKPRWGDKTPTYRGYLSDIARAVPEARFIHIIRDGRDVALSHRGLWFGPGDDIQRQASFWVDEIERTRAQARDLPFYLELRFEDLVTQPEAELDRICRFLDLPYASAMLDYHARAQDRMSEYVQTFGLPGSEAVPIERFRSIHERTQASPDAGRIGRWKAEMTYAELRSYEQIAGPMLRALDYPLER